MPPRGAMLDRPTGLTSILDRTKWVPKADAHAQLVMKTLPSRYRDHLTELDISLLAVSLLLAR